MKGKNYPLYETTIFENLELWLKCAKKYPAEQISYKKDP